MAAQGGSGGRTCKEQRRDPRPRRRGEPEPGGGEQGTTPTGGTTRPTAAAGHLICSSGDRKGRVFRILYTTIRCTHNIDVQMWRSKGRG